jgi:hypothetical protein
MKFEEEVLTAQNQRFTGPQPGEIYKHYKGDLYIIKVRSISEGDFKQLVTYFSMSMGYCWTRTLEDFTSLVNGEPRFKLISNI